MGLVLYSLLLGTVMVLGAPVWGWRMLRQHRYRAGLGQRLGQVPAALQQAVKGRRVVWLHAVSVGEVLAAERLVHELDETLGPDWRIVVSTTTETGQRIAQERFGADRVFFWPLDFAWTVRRYLRVLRPVLLVLVESELWPRMLRECRRDGIPVAVVNARMSDRSFGRARRVPWLWRWMAEGVTTFFAQGQETAERLQLLGAADIRVPGNLKYDLQRSRESATVSGLRTALRGRPLVVAGSTLEGEEQMLLDAWDAVLSQVPDAVLLIAPRHPQRFAEVQMLLGKSGKSLLVLSRDELSRRGLREGHVVLLDTLGQLAEVYGLAAVAFVGGSLVPRGGHNPLEAARFGVPVVMGPSYQNFREIVDGMLAEDAIAVVQPERLAWAFGYLMASHDDLTDDGIGIGGRGKLFFEAQAGATARTVQALREMIGA